MSDKDSEIIIDPRLYKSALEAAKIENKSVSEFIEEAINNQINVGDETKQLALLEKELSTITRRTQILKDKAYERIDKLEKELNSYKSKYKTTASKLSKLNEKDTKLKKELEIKSKKLLRFEKDLADIKNKYYTLLPKYKKINKLFKENTEKIKELLEQALENEEKIRDYKAKYENLQEDFNKLEEVKDEATKRADELSIELSRVKDEISKIEDYKAEIEKYKEAYAKVYERYNLLKKEFEKNEKIAKSITDELNKKVQEIDNLKSENKKLELRYKQTNDQLIDLTKQLSDYDKELKENKVRITQIEDLERDNKKLKDKLKELEESKRKVISKLNSELEEYKQKDLDNKKLYEDLISQSKTRYQILAQNIPIGMLIIQSMKVEFFNNYFLRMIGYNKKEISDIFKVFTRKSEKELKQELKSKEPRTDFELEAKTKEGNKILLEVKLIKAQYAGSPAYILLLKDVTYKKELNKSKSDLETVQTTLKDKDEIIMSLKQIITQKSNEVQNILKEKESILKDLEKTKQTLKSLKESPATNMIILTDVYGNISSVNTAITHQLGYKLEDFVGKEGDKETNILELIANNEERAKIEKIIKQINIDRRPIIEKISIKNKQGEIQKLLLRMELILDMDSEPMGIVIILSELIDNSNSKPL